MHARQVDAVRLWQQRLENLGATNDGDLVGIARRGQLPSAFERCINALHNDETNAPKGGIARDDNIVAAVQRSADGTRRFFDP